MGRGAKAHPKESTGEGGEGWVEVQVSPPVYISKIHKSQVVRRVKKNIFNFGERSGSLHRFLVVVTEKTNTHTPGVKALVVSRKVLRKECSRNKGVHARFSRRGQRGQGVRIKKQFKQFSISLLFRLHRGSYKKKRKTLDIAGWKGAGLFA